jgi:predicted aminopeptidase
MPKKLLLIAIVAAAAAASLTCSPVYVLRAGVEEAKILSRRQPIEKLVQDPATDAETRRKLDLVVQARTFAHEVLGLETGESYTTYSWIDRDTLALVLSAARRDRFEPVTWWFPIVGRVPYKGYFSAESAKRAAERLERRGFDTYVRPTTAFSTLGWFNDPLLSTLLRYDDVNLVGTVIHELTHNTLFIPGKVSFNESFANFVGERGAAAFFCSLEGETGERCIAATRSWSDNLVFAEYLSELIGQLEEVYGHPEAGLDAVLAKRDTVFTRSRQRFNDEYLPRFQTSAFAGYTRIPINNAHLVGWRLYYDRLHIFEEAFQRLGLAFPEAVAAMIKAADSGRDDPFAAVAALPSTE